MAALQVMIKYVTVYASEFERSMAFYRDGLGLKITYQEDGFAQFDTEGAILTLERGGEKSEKPKDFRKNGVLLQFEVEDLWRTAGNLKERNVKFTQEVTELEFGKIAMIVDPDGNQIQLLEQ